ncbi:MAG: ATP-binding cassette domain-containing protein [Erysipelotrichales bacterium]|nr:ATP-binding cassette domain-containing protein [Erysipelotrichales bacterium]
MLELKNVTKSFGSLVAVNDISFSVNNGEIFGLLGTNGAGKTTTFRMIMGLLKPNAGEITWNGEIIDFKKTDDIGFFIEERSLVPKLTVYKQIMHYARLKSMEPKIIEERLDYWLDRFNVPEYKHKKIKELSKGNQQKIQFISAIINNPKLLILDEPFSGLDSINVELFVEVIREFQKRDAIIIFSSHRIDHVELFCEKLIFLQKGKPILNGFIEDIKDQYKKKTIKIGGKVDVEKLKAIKGVVSVTENLNELSLSIESDAIAKDVFNYIKTCDVINKYSLEKPSLNEIFINKVGASFDE